MSMPLPIHVALIGSTVEQVVAAKKSFRLSTPGIGAPYLSALNVEPGGKILTPTDLPKALITIWLCLDPQSLAVSKKLHSQDIRNPQYGRGSYEELLPEPCVLVGDEKVSSAVLKEWAEKITEAWLATS